MKRFTSWCGLSFWQKLKSVDLIEYIRMQDSIIVIIVLIFYDLLNLSLSEESCKQREIGTWVEEGDRQEQLQTLFRIKSVYFRKQNTRHNTHNII